MLWTNLLKEINKSRADFADEGKATLEKSGEDVYLHSKRVEKMYIYARNEWKMSSGGWELMFNPDFQKNLKREKKAKKANTNEQKKDEKERKKYTRFEWRRCGTPLVPSVFFSWRRIRE
jgi:hypothetical protein